MGKKQAMFNGMSPKDLRVMLGVPKDFRLDALLGVPINDCPRRYLVTLLESAVYEVHAVRKRLSDAFDFGEKLEKKEKPDPSITDPKL